MKINQPTRTAAKAALAIAVLVTIAVVPIRLHAAAEERAAVEKAAVAHAEKIERAENHREMLLTNKAKLEAQQAVAEAEAVIATAAEHTDVTDLEDQVVALSSIASLGSKEIIALVRQTDEEAAVTAEEARVVAEAKAAAAAAKAAADAAAEAARVEQARAASLAHHQTPNGARELGAHLAATVHGWGGGEFSCLERLWTKESNWRYDAYNAGGGATGIPQSLPGSKMATFGADYLTNPETQIRWGLDYIKRAYGTPCAAWGHSVQKNWY